LNQGFWRREARRWGQEQWRDRVWSYYGRDDSSSCVYRLLTYDDLLITFGACVDFLCSRAARAVPSTVPAVRGGTRPSSHLRSRRIMLVWNPNPGFVLVLVCIVVLSRISFRRVVLYKNSSGCPPYMLECTRTSFTGLNLAIAHCKSSGCAHLQLRPWRQGVLLRSAPLFE
jgi:hypothetical protein